MSKRAEEAALKAYPKEDGKVWHSAFGTLEFDKNAPGRTAYRQGYEQAQKDSTLTWENVREIVRIADDLCNEWGTEKMHNEGQEAYYTEVLKRFDEKRK